MTHDKEPHLLSDPSPNVTEIVRAAIERLNDIHGIETIRINDRFNAEHLRVNESIEAERRRVSEQMALRADYDAKLQIAEAKRIDAIRAVDVAAVAVANERATAQAAVLAGQVVTSAETLRALVATTASTSATATAATAATLASQLATISAQISDRLTALEKSQYEGIGRGRVVDPQMHGVVDAIADLQRRAATTAGASGGMRDIYGWVLGGLMALVAVGSVVIALLQK